MSFSMLLCLAMSCMADEWGMQSMWDQCAVYS